MVSGFCIILERQRYDDLSDSLLYLMGGLQRERYKANMTDKVSAVETHLVGLLYTKFIEIHLLLIREIDSLAVV
jgi:hypothetical protein